MAGSNTAIIQTQGFQNRDTLNGYDIASSAIVGGLTSAIMGQANKAFDKHVGKYIEKHIAHLLLKHVITETTRGSGGGFIFGFGFTLASGGDVDKALSDGGKMALTGAGTGVVFGTYAGMLWISAGKKYTTYLKFEF